MTFVSLWGGTMWDKLTALASRYEELGGKIADPAVLAARETWQGLVKEHARLTPVVECYKRYKTTSRELDEARALLAEAGADGELRSMIESEIAELSGRKEAVEQELRALLVPRDPMDDRNVIIEVRAGTGGGEAALFAADLFRMYSRYAERQGWGTEVLVNHVTDMGGLKEGVLAVKGGNAYSRLKFESGVHRVQRVPVTESSGRIHTSAATVAVLPEAEEVDVAIAPDDLVIETFCASGPGGQHVNKTESAVRITHVPTRLVVSCQDEKSQHKNRDKAMRVLRSRLLKLAQDEKHREVAELRRSQVGTGDRSERIRTYNFPQTRVTDHRLGLTLHRLDAVIDGDLDEVVDALVRADQARRMWQAE